MRERQDDLDALGVQVFAVTFESRSRINDFQQHTPFPYPLLRDRGRVGYRTFGIERRGMHRIWSPGTIWYYTRQFFRGRLPPLSKSDPYQLGGDVVLRPDLSGGWVYRSRHPADRPSVDSILRKLNSG